MSNVTTLQDLMDYVKEKIDVLKNKLKEGKLVSLISSFENLTETLETNQFNASEIDLRKILNQTIEETVSNAKAIIDEVSPKLNQDIIDAIDKIFVKYNNKNIKLITKISEMITDFKTNPRKKILIAETKGGIIYLIQELEKSLLSLGSTILKTLASRLPISLDDETIDNFFSEYKNKVDTLIKSIKTFVKESKQLANSTLYKSLDEKEMAQRLTDFLQESRNEIIEALKEEYLNKNIFEIYNNVSAKIKIKLEELKEKIIELNITQLTELYQNLESKLSALKTNIKENEHIKDYKHIYSNFKNIYPYIKQYKLKELYNEALVHLALKIKKETMLPFASKPLNTTFYDIIKVFNPDEFDKLASALKENEPYIHGNLNDIAISLKNIRESMIEGNGNKFIDSSHELKEKILNIIMEKGKIFNDTIISKFNDVILKIYKNLSDSTEVPKVHDFINKAIPLYAELRAKIEKNKELLNGTIYNLTKALIDFNNRNTTPLADKINVTLDKEREDFIEKLTELRDFGIKTMDILQNIKNLSGSEIVDLPGELLKNLTDILLNKNDSNSTTLPTLQDLISMDNLAHGTKLLDKFKDKLAELIDKSREIAAKEEVVKLKYILEQFKNNNSTEIINNVKTFLDEQQKQFIGNISDKQIVMDEILHAIFPEELIPKVKELRKAIKTLQEKTKKSDLAIFIHDLNESIYNCDIKSLKDKIKIDGFKDEVEKIDKLLEGSDSALVVEEKKKLFKMVIDNIKKKTTELLNDPEIQPLTEQLKQIKAKSEEALKHMKIYEKYKKNMNNIKASTNVMKEYIDKAEIFLLNSQFRLRDLLKSHIFLKGHLEILLNI